ncbi:MAG: MBOAT family O-acyltransferase [Eubacteriales bacterium]|nr:MBOAT family O-acyltransferase [Eubacteriales bacterium]
MLENFKKTFNFIFGGVTMSYNSLMFFVLVMLLLLIMLLCRSVRARRNLILIASLGFYVWAGGKLGICVILLTTFIVYVSSRRMGTIYEEYEQKKDEYSPKERMAILNQYKKRTRWYMYLTCILVWGIWIYIKVGKLFLNTTDSFRAWTSGFGILVPLGISYYTLSLAGYIMDVYWRKAKAEKNFLNLLTVVTYFPHIVQGPIGKYDKLLKQLKNIPPFEYERVCFGLQLMFWGYFKKLVIADRVSIFTSTVFRDVVRFSGVEILLAVVLCVFQLYADFSGCMDIVRGISQALGIELDQNFKQPFASRTAAEFWRRWHATLGAWTKDYIYMPIALGPKYMKWVWAQKKKTPKWFFGAVGDVLPLLLVWLFTGLWHGSGWDYVVWGIYWFLIMIVSQMSRPLVEAILQKMKIQTEQGWYQIVQRIKVFFLFAMGRMFTVAGGLAGCRLLWKRLFTEHKLWVLFDGSLYNYGVNQRYAYVIFLGIVLMLLVDRWHENGVKLRETVAAMPIYVRWPIYFALIFSIVILGTYGAGYDATSFVYGAF